MPPRQPAAARLICNTSSILSLHTGHCAGRGVGGFGIELSIGAAEGLERMESSAGGRRGGAAAVEMAAAARARVQPEHTHRCRHCAQHHRIGQGIGRTQQSEAQSGARQR